MNPRKKKKLIITTVLSVIFLIIVISTIVLANHKSKPKPTPMPTSSSKVEKSSSSSEVEEKDARDQNYIAALATLEKSDTKGTDDDLKTAKKIFKLVESKVKENKVPGDFEGTIDNGLAMTDNPMAQSYAIAVKVNHYHINFDKIEVYKSLNSDVIQFILPLESDGQETSYWVGNINIYAEQAQIVSYHGGKIGATYG